MFVAKYPPSASRAAWLLLVGLATAGFAGAADKRGKDARPGTGGHAVPATRRGPAMPAYGTAHFQLQQLPAAAGAAALGKRLESLFDRHLAACRLAGFAFRAPARPLEWVFAPQAAAPPEGGNADPEGDAFYLPQDGRVILQSPPAGTEAAACVGASPERPTTLCLSHELAHQLAYSTGLQTPGVQYAFWFAEGLAANFETASLTATNFCGANPYRQSRLVAACRAGRLLPLGELLVLAQAPREWEARDYGYAQAWGLVRFLFQRDAAAFRTYLNSLALRPRGRRPDAALRREFIQAFGPLEEVDADWQRFLAGQVAEDETPSGFAMSHRASD
jgi:hypothetical protein